MGVLFGAGGRITANQFWQGIILLVGLQIVLYVGAAYASLWLFILFFLLIYPYVCVYAKRLHDSGKSGWLFLAFFVGWVIASFVLGEFMSGFSNIDQAGIEAQAEELAAQGDLGALFALYKQTLQEGMVLQILSIAVLNFVVGFFAARLHSDPHANQYGPPVGGAVAGGGQASDDDDIFS